MGPDRAAAPARIDRIIFSRDREGRYKDRMPTALDVQLSLDGRKWQTVAVVQKDASPVHRVLSASSLPPAIALPSTQPLREEDLLAYAFACEARSFRKVDPADPLARAAPVR